MGPTDTVGGGPTRWTCGPSAGLVQGDKQGSRGGPQDQSLLRPGYLRGLEVPALLLHPGEELGRGKKRTEHLA